MRFWGNCPTSEITWLRQMQRWIIWRMLTQGWKRIRPLSLCNRWYYGSRPQKMWLAKPSRRHGDQLGNIWKGDQGQWSLKMTQQKIMAD
eukprot:1529016-Ditylum_brightwellii.AAC.1